MGRTLCGLLLLAVMAGCHHKSGVNGDSVSDSMSQSVPSSAFAALENGVGSSDVAVRGAALAGLVSVSESPVVWLQRGAWDPSGWVQREVFLAYIERVGLSDPNLLESTSRSGAAPSAAGEVGFQMAKSTIDTGWIQGLDAAGRSGYLDLALAVAGDQSAVDRLSVALADGEVWLDTRHIMNIGNSSLSSLVAPMEEGLAWVEPEAELLFAAALLGLGSTKGHHILRSAIENTSHPEAQLEAVESVLMMDSDESLALLRKFSHGKETTARGAVRLALAAKGAWNTSVFQSSMESPDRELRVFAMRVIAFTDLPKDKHLVRAVKTGLADPQMAVQLAALRGAYQLRLSGVAGVSVLLSSDQDELKVAAARAALSKQMISGR